MGPHVEASSNASELKRNNQEITAEQVSANEWVRRQIPTLLWGTTKVHDSIFGLRFT